MIDLAAPYPNITIEQDLLRLKHHLALLPTNLLKHVHLQRVRRQNPNLFFAALADDISGL
jgi:malate dehydrogenase (oxaloacetate-decarboxylating)(NADP+)